MAAADLGIDYTADAADLDIDYTADAADLDIDYTADDFDIDYTADAGDFDIDYTADAADAADLGIDYTADAADNAVNAAVDPDGNSQGRRMMLAGLSGTIDAKVSFMDCIEEYYVELLRKLCQPFVKLEEAKRRLKEKDEAIGRLQEETIRRLRKEKEEAIRRLKEKDEAIARVQKDKDDLIRMMSEKCNTPAKRARIS